MLIIILSFFTSTLPKTFHFTFHLLPFVKKLGEIDLGSRADN
jgi:hypothetical protein